MYSDSPRGADSGLETAGNISDADPLTSNGMQAVATRGATSPSGDIGNSAGRSVHGAIHCPEQSGGSSGLSSGVSVPRAMEHMIAIGSVSGGCVNLTVNISTNSANAGGQEEKK